MLKDWKKTGTDEWTNNESLLQINIHWSAFGFYVSGVGSNVKPFKSKTEAVKFVKKYMEAH